MKKYYTTIPQQPVPDGLRLTEYKNPGCSPLLNYGKTRFPIVAVIANSAKKGDAVRVYGIKPEHENTSHWEAELKAELDGLKENIGFSYEFIVLETAMSETVENHLALFKKLIDTADDNDHIYADITFGTKPIPIVMLMFMNYTYKYRDNAEIESIVYGQFNNATKEAALYDVSALFYMNATVDRLDNASDPVKVIEMLLGLDNTEG